MCTSRLFHFTQNGLSSFMFIPAPTLYFLHIKKTLMVSMSFFIGFEISPFVTVRDLNCVYCTIVQMISYYERPEIWVREE